MRPTRAEANQERLRSVMKLALYEEPLSFPGVEAVYTASGILGPKPDHFISPLGYCLEDLSFVPN